MLLSELNQLNIFYEVTHIKIDSLSDFLLEMGFYSGVSFSLFACTPFKGFLIIEFDGNKIAIDYNDAKQIEIALINS